MLLLRKQLRALAAVGFVLGMVVLSGCSSRDEIARYTVPKPELIDPMPVAAPGPADAVLPQETLGAIVVVGEMGWFFKLTGDPEAVQPQQEAFRAFLQSLQFTPGPDAKPTWTLPEGWRELPGSGMRFATIQISAVGKRLDLTVIPLPKREADTQKFVLANVNRWRDQLNLKPTTAEELAKSAEMLNVGGYDCTFVRLVGTGSGGMGGLPMAPVAGGAATPRSGGERDASRPGIAYESPPEWKASRLREFSKATFTISHEGKVAEVTVSDLDINAGDLLSNVNRWRAQVNLPPVTAVELASTVKRIETLGTQGDYVELVGPGGQTILGVMAVAGGRAWFIKLTGDAELAQREKPRFEAFVKSLRLK